MKIQRTKLKTGMLALASAVAAISFHTQAAELVPTEGKLFSIGQDVDSINNYVSSINKVPGGVVNYVGIKELEGLTSNADAGAGRNNVAELAATYPDSALIVGVSMNESVDAVAAGQYNANIDTLLTNLASYNRPVYLRWAYEVDGPWNRHSTNGVITSFRYVYNRIRELGFEDRISMVWQVASYCPNPAGLGAYEAYWPGDEYVDWVGLSYFTPQDCNWQRVNDAAQFARNHGKPVFINEATPQRYDIDELTYNFGGKSAQQIWDEWFVPFFNFINEPNNNVLAITYINADWHSQPRWGGGGEGYWGDSRTEINNLIRTNWLAEVNKSQYLHKQDGLFEILDGTFKGGNDDPSDPVDPIDPMDPSGAKVEAESGSVANGASVFQDAAASGGAGVAYLSSNGAQVTINNVPASDGVTVTYATPNSGSISLYVDGQDAGTLNFSSSGAWTGSYNQASANLTIPEGSNFSIRYDNGDTALNADLITFHVLDDQACTGADMPAATISKTNETAVGANDGSITFRFSDDAADRTSIEFSLDGGTSYTVSSPLADGQVTVTDLAPGRYDLWARWGEEDCATDINNANIVAAQPPVGDDSIVYLVHRQTGYKMQACSVGETVTAVETPANDSCAQWQVVRVNDTMIDLVNVAANGLLKVDSKANGVSYSVTGINAKGPKARWTTIQSGNYNLLNNRFSRKNIHFSPKNAGGQPLQQPRSWNGKFSQWEFVPVQ